MDKIQEFQKDEVKLAEILLQLYCDHQNLPGGKSLQDWWEEAPKGAKLKIDGKVVATKE